MTVRSLAAALAVLALSAAPASARSIYASPALWATVNVCNTKSHPDTIGIRGSMPGSGYVEERMFMRFQVQYYDTTEQRWHNLLAGGDSGWVRIGSARYRSRQAGRMFRFSAPAAGVKTILRGAVTFEWRQGDIVVRRARKRTTAGHHSATGAEPKHYSAAVCELDG